MIVWEHNEERRPHWTAAVLHMRARWGEEEYEYVDIDVWPDSHNISLSSASYNPQITVDNGTLLTIMYELPREIRKVWQDWPVDRV